MSASDLKALSSLVSVGPQLRPEDMAELRNLGFTCIINNRPDHEEPDQPASDTIELAARAAGLEYIYAPVRGLPDEHVVAEAARSLRSAKLECGRVAMFCRSGMRSVATWALASRLDGADPDDLRAAAAEAGYDLSRLPL